MAEIKKLESFDAKEIEDVKILIKIKGQHFAVVPKQNMKSLAMVERIDFVKKLFKTHDVVAVPLEQLSPKKVLQNMQTQKKNRIGAYDPKKREVLDAVQEYKRRHDALMHDVVADDWREAMVKWRADVVKFLSVPGNEKYKDELEEFTKVKFNIT